MVNRALRSLILLLAAWAATAGAELRVGLEPTVIDELGTTRLTIRAGGTNQAQTLDLSALEQLVDDSQARAIGVLLKRLGEVTREPVALRDALDAVLDDVARRGLAALDPSPELALPRRFELAAAVNRLRALVVEPA